MVDKMIIIYDYDGYKDPKIKNVEVSKVNGYKTIITKEGKEVKNKMTNEKKFTDREAKVNIYLREHPGTTYREAVLKSGIGSESEEKKSEKEEYVSLSKDEVLRAKKLIDDIVYNLSLAKKSDSFNKTDQEKLDQAYILVKEVDSALQILVGKQG
jgi:hypothetical protein